MPISPGTERAIYRLSETIPKLIHLVEDLTRAVETLNKTIEKVVKVAPEETEDIPHRVWGDPRGDQ